MFNAAMAAGYSRSYALARCNKIEMSEDIGMRDAFERAGLTAQTIAQETARIALNAKKLHSCDIYLTRDENGKFVVNENSNDFIEIEDEQTRLRALELAGKYRGDLTSKENKVIVVNNMPEISLGNIRQEFAFD